jgi:hypothetical protein
MLYIVECSYADPESEAGWNRFYSEDKLPRWCPSADSAPRSASGRSPPAARSILLFIPSMAIRSPVKRIARKAAALFPLAGAYSRLAAKPVSLRRRLSCRR